MQQQEKKPLSNFAVNSYGAYGTLQSVGFRIPFMYLTMFMTTYLGINAATMGTIMLIAKSCDFCVSLVAGGIVQSSSPKKGKYLPWMRTLRWVIAAGAILQMLNTSALPMAVRAIVIIIGYCMLHCSMNFMSTCQYGIMAAMAGSNMDDRFRMTSRQTQINAAGSIIMSFGTLPLVTFVGNMVGDAALGYTLTAAFGTLFLIGGVEFLSKAAAPYDLPRDPNLPVPPRPKVADMIKAIFTNDQMVIYMSYQIINQVGTNIVSGMMMYYWMHIMDKFTMYSIGQGITTCLGFVFSMFIPKIGKKLGKKRATLVSTTLNIACKFLMFFFATKSIWCMVAINALASAGMYLTMGFGVNYYLDIGEYGYYKTGKDFRTLSMSMTNIPMKVAMAIGGALSGYTLAFIGFDNVNAAYLAGTLDRSSEMFKTFVSKYMLIYCFVPVVFTLVAMALFNFGYKINDENAKFYAAENAKRAAAEKEAKANA